MPYVSLRCTSSVLRLHEQGDLVRQQVNSWWPYAVII